MPMSNNCEKNTRNVESSKVFRIKMFSLLPGDLEKLHELESREKTVIEFARCRVGASPSSNGCEAGKRIDITSLLAMLEEFYALKCS